LQPGLWWEVVVVAQVPTGLPLLLAQCWLPQALQAAQDTLSFSTDMMGQVAAHTTHRRNKVPLGVIPTDQGGVCDENDAQGKAVHTSDAHESTGSLLLQIQ
jgi:hypothetical protein